MPTCLKNSFLTIVLFIAYLFLFDLVWLFLPNLSLIVDLVGTIATVVVSFKLAMMTSNKIFPVIKSC